MRAIIAAVSVCGLALAACSDNDGGGQDTRPYDTPADIAEALSAAGIECTGYGDGLLDDELPEGEVLIDAGPDQREATGTCDHDGTELTIDLFESKSRQDQFNQMGATLGCAFGAGFGITEVYYARGNLWQVESEDNLDAELVDEIAASLDGETQHIECDT